MPETKQNNAPTPGIKLPVVVVLKALLAVAAVVLLLASLIPAIGLAPIYGLIALAVTLTVHTVAYIIECYKHVATLRARKTGSSTANDSGTPKIKMLQIIAAAVLLLIIAAGIMASLNVIPGFPLLIAATAVVGTFAIAYLISSLVIFWKSGLPPKNKGREHRNMWLLGLSVLTAIVFNILFPLSIITPFATIFAVVILLTVFIERTVLAKKVKEKLTPDVGIYKLSAGLPSRLASIILITLLFLSFAAVSAYLIVPLFLGTAFAFPPLAVIGLVGLLGISYIIQQSIEMTADQLMEEVDKLSTDKGSLVEGQQKEPHLESEAISKHSHGAGERRPSVAESDASWRFYDEMEYGGQDTVHFESTPPDMERFSPGSGQKAEFNKYMQRLSQSNKEGHDPDYDSDSDSSDFRH